MVSRAKRTTMLGRAPSSCNNRAIAGRSAELLWETFPTE
jgi:hypothetical protein